MTLRLVLDATNVLISLAVVVMVAVVLRREVHDTVALLRRDQGEMAHPDDRADDWPAGDPRGQRS